MKMRLPAAANDRRAVLIGGAVVVCAILLRLAPPALRGARAARDRSDVSAHQLFQARQIVAAVPTLRDSLAKRLGRLVSSAPAFVAGATPADAGSELASLVSVAAVRHRVRIVRQDTRPDSVEGIFERVAVRLDAEGDVAGVIGWIAELESERTLLSAGDLVISTDQYAAPPTQPEVLRVEVTISGLRIKRSGE